MVDNPQLSANVCGHMRVNGDALRVIRERSGYGVNAFAAHVGISSSHLSDIERGRRNPSPDVARRIADALDVPVASIEAVA